jgi:hypothetical protein
MFGQHRLERLTAAAAMWLLIGPALIRSAHAQTAAPAAPHAVSSPAAASAAPVAHQPAPAAAAAPKASPALSAIDHAILVPTQPSGLRPGDHVLILKTAPPKAQPAAYAVPAPNAGPASASPQTPPKPAAPVAVSNPAPPSVANQALATPATKPVPAPPPAATAKSATAQPPISPIDHVLLVSVHPPGLPGTAQPTDHAFVWPKGETPGREMLASLDFPEGHHLTEGQERLVETTDESCRDPVSWAVIVHKSAYKVDVFYKGKQFDSFEAVFGRNPDHSAKQWEGDLRTPEGNYLIIEKYYNPRWKWFLRLNYPNYDDRVHYSAMREEGLVPVIRGHLRMLGGSIGIHGTDRPRFNRLHVNWTLGCISVDNDADQELERILPVGTLVIIKP